jgi:hypothetical protein
VNGGLAREGHLFLWRALNQENKKIVVHKISFEQDVIWLRVREYLLYGVNHLWSERF